MRTVVALTAPVEPLFPEAATQSPTLRFDAAALWFSEYAVVDVRVTVTLVVLRADGFLDVLLGRLADETPVRTRLFAFTDVTFPLAKPVFPAPPNPPGRPAPPPGRVPLAPAGGPPDLPPNPPEPEGRPPPKAPVVHLPEEGWLTVTDLAVIAPFDVVPEMVTQSPVATDEAETVATWEKVVEVLQLTVTWPVCWFWTSIDVPEMAATDPEVPGNPPPPAGVVAAPAAVAVARLAATAMVMIAAGAAWIRGTRRLTLCSPSSQRGFPWPVGSFRGSWSFAPEGIDRGHVGGPGSRVDTEDQADGDGYEE